MSVLTTVLNTNSSMRKCDVETMIQTYQVTTALSHQIACCISLFSSFWRKCTSICKHNRDKLFLFSFFSPSNSHSFSKDSTLTWKKLRSSVALAIQNMRGRRSEESFCTLGGVRSASGSGELHVQSHTRHTYDIH